MVLERKSSEDVLREVIRNKQRNWPSPSRGKERLFPAPQLRVSPGFSIKPEHKIFTVGSCFARNVERNLKAMGCDVLSADVDHVFNPVEGRQMFHRFNKYTVHSILQELAWALSDKPKRAGDELIELPNGEWADFQTLGEDITASEDAMLRFRQDFSGVFQRVREADVFIMTLGLVECWYDLECELYLNVAPSKRLCDKYPGRFEFQRLDFYDVHKALCDIHDLIRHSNPNINIMVTVSPVPLKTTFSGQDVLQANSYSKSVQRAAVEQFVSEKNADYFPSYEFITLAETRHSFGALDYRHVQRQAVQRVMGTVFETYMGSSEIAGRARVLGLADAALRDGDHEMVIDLINAHTDRYGLQPAMITMLAQSLIMTRRYDEARECLKPLVSTAKDDVTAMQAALGDRFGVETRRAKALWGRLPNPGAAGANPELLRALSVVDSLSGDEERQDDLDWLKSVLKGALTSQPPRPASADKPATEKPPHNPSRSTILSIKSILKREGPAKALTELNAALQSHPETDDLILLRAQLNRDCKNVDDALADFERVAKSNGDLAKIGHKQGSNYAKLAKHAEYQARFAAMHAQQDDP